jgi:DNA-binding Lrp family transcriptional regulator
MRKELAQRLLRELLKNSKRSDRELAKVFEVSQPTITRTRHKLEREGAIQDYTIVPDFWKMGFEILAITLTKMTPEILTPEIMEKARKYTQEFPNAIFSATGEGLGMTTVILSLHHNYTDYHRTWNKMRLDWKDYLKDIQAFIVSLKEGEIKRLSLTYLKDAPL